MEKQRIMLERRVIEATERLEAVRKELEPTLEAMRTPYPEPLRQRLAEARDAQTEALSALATHLAEQCIGDR